MSEFSIQPGIRPRLPLWLVLCALCGNGCARAGVDVVADDVLDDRMRAFESGYNVACRDLEFREEASSSVVQILMYDRGRTLGWGVEYTVDEVGDIVVVRWTSFVAGGGLALAPIAADAYRLAWDGEHAAVTVAGTERRVDFVTLEDCGLEVVP